MNSPDTSHVKAWEVFSKIFKMKMRNYAIHLLCLWQRRKRVLQNAAQPKDDFQTFLFKPSGTEWKLNNLTYQRLQSIQWGLRKIGMNKLLCRLWRSLESDRVRASHTIWLLKNSLIRKSHKIIVYF